MFRLFQFLKQYRAFLVFLTLEIVSFWLIIQNNSYHSSIYFNSSNRIVGTLFNLSNTFEKYFSLSKVNAVLMEENAMLREKITNNKRNDSDISSDFKEQIDEQYEFIVANVIKNSTRLFQNFITVNKGKKDGIQKEMGVVGNKGIVGQVKYVSENFSVITSILHSNMMVSSKLLRTGDLCTTRWNGKNFEYAEVLYIPKHVYIEIGDTIVTSGFNSIYPENIMVGIVEDYDTEGVELFHRVKVKLASEMNRLSHVYLIKNHLSSEQKLIQNQAID